MTMINKRTDSILIGLTGGIASGKSTVSNLLAKAGLPIVDADKVARNVVSPGTEGLTQLADHFGKEIISKTGDLDRQKLAAIVFADPSQRHVLNQLLQPRIKSEIYAKVNHLFAAGARIVVIDVPLLFETGYASDCDRIVVVNVRPEIQLKRLMQRNGYSESQAKRRIQAQMPLPEKVSRADYVIDNNGDRVALQKSVKDFLSTLPQYNHQ